jgi:hypothetical protein
MIAPSLASLGQVMQMAYVPKDVDAALAFWLKLGAGPFFTLSHVKMEDVRYRGEPTDCDFSIWLGHWGDMQIELIQQHNDAPSIYKAWSDAGHEGVQHVCIVVDDMAKARAVCAERGYVVAQEGKLAGGGEAIYVDTGGGSGTMIEILKSTPEGAGFFAFLRDAARDWDGSDPIRSLG